MALTFIYGNPGSGKSSRLIETLKNHTIQDPRKRIWLIVPEQYTLQTQKQMVRRSDGHVITNIDVVSFERLAFRAFDEIGLRPSVMEDYGKSLMLRKIASDRLNDIGVLRTNIRHIGYIEEVKSMLSEMMQYDIKPDRLEEICKKLPEGSSLQKKIADLLVLYREMEKRFRDSLIPAEHLPDLLAVHANDVPGFHDAIFAFDGFTGFTPVQNQLVRRLMKLSSQMYVTVTLDSADSKSVQFFASAQEGLATHMQTDMEFGLRIEDLFYMSKKMILDLLRMADAQGVSVTAPVCMVQDGQTRHFQKRALRHLEQNMFRSKPVGFAGPQSEIGITSCANPKEELEYAAACIAEMVRAMDCRYSDFAIVSADPATYDKYMDTIMHRYGIPCFSDRKRDIMYHPLTETIRALLEIIYSDFSVESVCRLLKAGLTGYTDDEIHLLENYCIARGIHGFRRWSTPFRVPMRQTRDIARRTGKDGENLMAEEMLLLNRLRSRFTDILSPLYLLFSDQDTDRQASVRAISETIFHILTGLNVEGRLVRMQENLIAGGRETEGAVYEQIYAAEMDLLDKYVSLLGEEKMDAFEYAQILDAGLAGMRIGILPPGSDCVILGDIERTRLDGIRWLFFLGVNDGLIPQNTDRGGILSQYDRDILQENGVRLAPSAREQVFLQHFYLYWNLTQPSEGLFLTYARLDRDGKAILPSYLVGKLSQMFPGMEIGTFEQEANRNPVTPESAVSVWLSGLDYALEQDELLPNWAALHRYYNTNNEWKIRIRQFMDARFAAFGRDVLLPDTARTLYGTTLSNSVSRMEQFVKCPRMHFLSYGLRLNEREIFDVTPADLGSMMHEALARFSEKVDRTCAWHDLTREIWEPLLSESILETELAQKESVIYETAANHHRLDMVRRTLTESVDAMVRQIRSGRFIPVRYETDFKIDYLSQPDMAEILRDDSALQRLYLKGRIDRIDRMIDGDKQWLRVVDYKSGDDRFDLLSFYHGLKMQLIVYLDAAMRQSAGSNSECGTGGVFYYHLDDPIIDWSEAKTDQTTEEMIFETYRLRGYVNADPVVYRGMDGTFEKKSRIVPVSLKKDGQPDAHSKTADERSFALLRRHAVQKNISIAESILAGEISPLPYQLGTKTGCDYCPYKTVCGFDRRIAGYRFRELEDLNEEEIWNHLKDEQKEES